MPTPFPPVQVDDLTQLPLRSAFRDAMVAAVGAARGTGEPVSLLVVDVDHFKLVNDHYGHLQGDDVLAKVADILRRNLREGDFAARYAGDEFVALLPNTTTDGAREVAQRIGAAVRGHLFPRRQGGGHVSVTVSQGVASFPDHGADGEMVFAAADAALYLVKRQGRDGVAVAPTGERGTTALPLSIERFVGRHHELRTLIRLLDEATAGHPKVVAITGEAGVGKTTLIRQLEPEVRLRGGSLVTGRCQEGAAQPPYAPWAEVIATLERVDRPPPRPWRELPYLVPSLGGGSPAGERPGSRYLLLDELSDYVRGAAARRPLVIVLDDVQWADSASWDALEHLVPQLERERVLVCLAIRSEETVGEPLTRRRRLSRRDSFRELVLPRLTREELKQWIEAAFHRTDVGRELLAFLYRHTEGNPLFVVQLLRTLVEEGAIWHTGDRWEWRPVSELRLPIGVTDIISRRLSRLSPEAHALLTVAAVVGRDFDLDLVIEAVEEDEDAVLDAIDEGIEASVVHATGGREAERYAFAHILLAEVLRASANPRRLRKIHQRVAEVTERRSPEAVSEITAHYDRAGDAASAYRWALHAAAEAKRVYANQEATDFLRVAERNAASPTELAEVRVRLAEVAEALGRYDEAEELCDLAIEWFAGHGDVRRALPLRRMRERVRAALGQPARRTLEACLSLDAQAQALAADGERAALLTLISQTHVRLGDRAAAERVARECAALAERVGDPRLLADSLKQLGVTIEPDSTERAAECYRRALALYEQAGDVAGQARCHNNLGVVHTSRGEWEAARTTLRRAIALGRSTGAPDLWGLFSLNLGVVQLRCGDYDGARELFGEALALFAAVKNSERELYALLNLAHLDRERGEYASAAELYDVAESLAQRIGQADVELGAVAGAGLARFRLGNAAAAQAAYHKADAHVRARPEWFQGRELAEALAVEVQASLGDHAGAAARFERARGLAEQCDVYAARWLSTEVGARGRGGTSESKELGTARTGH
jgi:diguanylate cyclase (GGDEF)-like protein